jgi:hypothetical protein
VLKFLQEFAEIFFLVVAMELLLGEEEFWTRQTRITALKGYNFVFGCWIALKSFQEYLKVFFH